MTIKVAIAEDFGLVRREIISLLNELDTIDVVAEFTDGQELLSYLASHPVDVALLDCDMPGLGGVGTCLKMMENRLDVPAIMFSTHQDKSKLDEAVQAGARGFLFKHSSLGEYHNAILRVHQGGTYFSSEVVDDLLEP